MTCCINCFSDSLVIDYINGLEIEGICNYCDSSDNVNVSNIGDIYYELFYKIEQLYEETEEGKHFSHQLDQEAWDIGDDLFQLVQDDWNIFSESCSEKLLYDILNVNEDYELGSYYSSTQLYSRYSDAFYHADESDLWDELRYNLIYKNRFFLPETLEWGIPTTGVLNRLKELMQERSSLIEPSQNLYRARIGRYIEMSDLNAPPPEKIIHGGRANAIGISILYTADNVDTAIAEVRPWKEAEVTIAQLKALSALNVVDLSKVTYPKSPFEFDNLIEVLSTIALVKRLHSTLSKPVDPNKVEIEYITSQFLTDFIRHIGFDGLIFKSSLGNGNNIVIFNSGKTEIIELSYYKIENININSFKIR